MICGHPLGSELQVAADGHQKIVEVVGDAARELPQRFQTLGAVYGLLGLGAQVAGILQFADLGGQLLLQVA